MRAVQAPFPATGVDCVTPITAQSAAALSAADILFCARYLGSLTSDELETILAAGLCVSPVTFADKFDPAQTLAELAALGVPHGVTIWLDVETVKEDPTGAINAWADALTEAGYQPGLYVGANIGPPDNPLLAEALYKLRVVRYWSSMSRTPTPQCGWVMRQLYPTTSVGGVAVDIDVTQHDWEGRSCTMIGPDPR
jgi:hypothetical protein